MQTSKFLGILLILLISSFCCLGQDVTFYSQAEVNAFNPSTTTISGSLIIDSVDPNQPSDISDLSNLSNLTTISGDLAIEFSGALINLDALSNLTTVGGDLSVRFNDLLVNVDGLLNLTSLNGKLWISQNDNLANINGLSNLTTVSGEIGISSNALLANLNGLSSLVSIGGNLELAHTALYTNLNGLSSLTTIGGDLVIYNSDALINLDGLSNLTSIGGELNMRFNLNLTNINGLSNVNSIGGDMDMSANNAITNIDGFSSLTSFNGLVKFQTCAALLNLNGLSNITSIGGDFIINANDDLMDISGLSNLTSVNGFFQIVNNNALTDLNGLSSLNSVGDDLTISYNDGLLNINSLSNLASIGDNFTIEENPLLTDCCSVQNLLIIPNAIVGSININNNQTTCDSESEILADDCGNNINYIDGNVYLDMNANCLFEQGDILYEQVIVQAESAEYTYTTVTDNLGNYEIYLDTGNYEIKTIIPNPYIGFCTSSFFANIIDDTVSDTFNFDFPAIINTYCPYLEVDVSTWALRECFDNSYTVQYCNSGTIDATNAYVELELDSLLSIDTSSISFTGPDINNIYTFDIGTVGIGTCGSFNVNILLPCDTLNAGQFQGQTLCVKAHIYPDSICLPPPSFWDGSSVEVTGSCEQDSVAFRVKNVGIGDMIPGKSLQVFEDQIMFIDNPFQLQSGEEIRLTYFANGSTYRLEAEQSDGHPGNSMPSIMVEGCGAGPVFSLGIINQFSQDDADVFVSSECREVTGSYDPNDKQAFPIGYGDAHYIEQNTDIEYLIRFQNTGTDTAFTVVIQDELSPLFDITTIQPGASSHPYSFEIDTVVRFVFNDILLVDSFTNEPASHGFVKFRISQEADLPIGTVIENTAGIYFDFNAPIITNTTFHTIGEDFITIELVSNIPDIFQLSAAKAYPNPFSKSITFELEGVIEEEVVLSVYDVNGKEVARENYDSSIFEFSRGRLMSGVYFYMISSDGIGLAKGKMILN